MTDDLTKFAVNLTNIWQENVPKLLQQPHPRKLWVFKQASVIHDGRSLFQILILNPKSTQQRLVVNTRTLLAQLRAKKLQRFSDAWPKLVMSGKAQHKCTNQFILLSGLSGHLPKLLDQQDSGIADITIMLWVSHKNAHTKFKTNPMGNLFRIVQKLVGNSTKVH